MRTTSFYTTFVQWHFPRLESKGGRGGKKEGRRESYAHRDWRKRPTAWISSVLKPSRMKEPWSSYLREGGKERGKEGGRREE